MKSMTCADLRKDLFCVLESRVLEDYFLLGISILDLILVVASVPENLVGTKFVFSTVDKMIVFH